MSGGSNKNVRLADWLYEYLCENGEAPVVELKDWINNVRRTKQTGRKVHHSYTSIQIAQVLRTSPLFDSDGEVRVTYQQGGAKVKLWRARTTQEILDKVGVKQTQHRLRSSQPKAVKKALETVGVIL